MEKEIMQAARDGIIQAIKDGLKGYGSPLNNLVKECFKERDGEIRGLLTEAIEQITLDKKVRAQMVEQIQHKLARTLVQDFGDGIFKKNLNILKSDPTIKARCVMAVERIIAE